jgi:hypothetical protein
LKPTKQIVATVAFGAHAERLDRTFTSFAINPHLELHAFIIGDALPKSRWPGVHYHLKPADPSFSHPLRDAVYRRWLFIDDLDAEYALVVDNGDVLCLQQLPEIPALLRGASFGASVEHPGSRYMPGQGYTANYINCGVTFWHVPSTRRMRQEIVARGRSYFRNIDDQRSINEVIFTRYFNDAIVLPCQYNYRPHLAPFGASNWPTVDHLDGVMIYHNAACIEAAKQLLPVKAVAGLPAFPADPAPLTPRQQLKRRVQERMKPHVVGAGPIRRLFSVT